MDPRAAGPRLGEGVDQLLGLTPATGMASPAGPTVTPSATVTGGAPGRIDDCLVAGDRDPPSRRRTPML